MDDEGSYAHQNHNVAELVSASPQSSHAISKLKGSNVREITPMMAIRANSPPALFGRTVDD